MAEGYKIAFILISILLVNIAYPISELGTAAALLFIGFYLVLTGSAIYLVSSNRRLLIAAVLLGVVIAVTGGITVTSGFTLMWAQLAWNASLFVQVVLLTTLLALFIIESETVTREVLLAAIAIYFLLAALFTVMYGVIESLAPGAFVSSNGAEITWQRLNYFSLVTISTLGYGDITPVTSTAQSLSALEASIGTLYIAILIGRFVSLYQHDKSHK
ncbi:hypothetical protein HC891_10920 [Candidatus Gracilibacteria bacterium]|nr:hypothetical protein [Candidatus Gracilibacteria bacterium]